MSYQKSPEKGGVRAQACGMGSALGILTLVSSLADDDFDQFDKPGAERSWRRRAADEDWDRYTACVGCVHADASPTTWLCRDLLCKQCVGRQMLFPSGLGSEGRRSERGRPVRRVVSSHCFSALMGWAWRALRAVVGVLCRDSCCQAVLCIILHFLSQGLCSPDSFEDNVTVTKKCYNCQPDQQFSLSCSCSKSIITEFS